MLKFSKIVKLLAIKLLLNIKGVNKENFIKILYLQLIKLIICIID